MESLELKRYFIACRTGNVKEIRCLRKQGYLSNLEVRETSPASQMTGLYLACLCGHLKVVDYLLKEGAVFNHYTIEGEQCFRAALTDNIQHRLREHHTSRYPGKRPECLQSKQQQPYFQFLARLLEHGSEADVHFWVQGKCISAHRCILAARSSFLAKRLSTDWSESNVTIEDPSISPSAFRVVLRFIYTGCFSCTASEAGDLIYVTREFNLTWLTDHLQVHVTRLCTRHEQHVKNTQHLRHLQPPKGPFDNELDITVDKKSSVNQLQTDLSDLAKQIIAQIEYPDTKKCQSTNKISLFPDICLQVGDYKVYCHKVFFFGRSEYFRALFMDHFEELRSGESCEAGDLPTIRLLNDSMDIEAFKHILYYLYSNTCQPTAETVYELLIIADMLLLSDLKIQCAQEMANYLDTENVVDVLLLSRHLHMDKLESNCTCYIAFHLNQLASDENFLNFLHEEVATASCEQAGDNDHSDIPFVMAVYYYLRRPAKQSNFSFMPHCCTLNDQYKKQNLNLMKRLLYTVRPSQAKRRNNFDLQLIGQKSRIQCTCVLWKKGQSSEIGDIEQSDLSSSSKPRAACTGMDGFKHAGVNYTRSKRPVQTRSRHTRTKHYHCVIV